MAEKTPSQVIINTEADASLQKAYPSSYQNIPPVVGNTSIYISATTENIYNNFVVNNNDPAGNTTEVQFNLNNHMSGDSGLTYNLVTDSLTVAGNVTSGNIRTDHLLYANGDTWIFSSGSYGNSNVAGYLPTHPGNIHGNIITGNVFSGSGASLTSIPSSSIVGSIANANYSTYSGTVLTNAQPNITSVGTLSSLTITGNITTGNANLGNLVTANYVTGTLTTGAQPNITSVGTLASITHAANANITMSGSLSQITGSNVVSASYLTGTLTTGAQPNITSHGSLIGLTVSNATGVVNFTTTANVTLGNVSNLHITGGSSGQFLSTNGSGTLSWATPSAPATSTLEQVTTAGNTTANAISITNTTESTNYNTGALKISGGLGVGNSIHVQGHISSVTTLYAGLYADFSSYTYPKFVGRDAGSAYIQAAMVNTTATGSADWVAYGDQSDETQGWSDFGFTGSNFNDANYSITKPNDGYFLVQGMDSTTGGNMVFATGSMGLNHDIVFAMGGFSDSDEFARMDYANKTLTVGGEIIIKNHNNHGGAGFAGMLTLNNDTATNGKKFVRINSTGGLEIINNLYSQTILGLSDAGDLSVYGNIGYSPSTPSDWSGTAPTTIGQALDRLATVVKALNGGTGA